LGHDAFIRLPPHTSIRAVQELVVLLGYRRSDSDESSDMSYFWFEPKDYKSHTGVSLSIRRIGKSVQVETHTPIYPSYWDAVQHNRTLSLCRRALGAQFTSDSGRNRLLPVPAWRPEPRESGCYLAFQRFGRLLIQAHSYLSFRDFPAAIMNLGIYRLMPDSDPRLISNSLLLPFLIACMEQYFKSMLVSLLRYSEKRDSFLKNSRIGGEHLSRIDNETNVEELIVELLPFQNISKIANHFRSLDSKIDIAGWLLKPHLGRKQSLFHSLEDMVERRHVLVHQAIMDYGWTDDRLVRALANMEAAVERCHRNLLKHYGWRFRKHWGCSPLRLETVNVFGERLKFIEAFGVPVGERWAKAAADIERRNAERK
jgi:hypothetical protein